jgi:hypothetical protein
MTRIVTYVHHCGLDFLPWRALRARRSSQPRVSNPQATIVTANRRGRLGDVPDITPEEYERRGAAADAVVCELVRQATGKQ